MSSTNKTTNYNLSQFLGTDKPAWLGDYNSDMQKIDTGIHSAQTTATGADGKADANTTAIGDITDLQTTAKTNVVAAINEVNTAVGTAQNTANDANATAIQAKGEADKLIEQFNFTTTTYGQNDLSFDNFSYTGGDLRVAINDDGSLFKVYGSIIGIVSANQPSKIHILNNKITVDQEYAIVNVGSYQMPDKTTLDLYATVKNGEIIIEFTPSFNGTVIERLMPCLYVNKNFGDVIPPAQ